jgi:hypothetical protein
MGTGSAYWEERRAARERIAVEWEPGIWGRSPTPPRLDVSESSGDDSDDRHRRRKHVPASEDTGEGSSGERSSKKKKKAKKSSKKHHHKSKARLAAGLFAVPAWTPSSTANLWSVLAVEGEEALEEEILQVKGPLFRR